MEVDPSRRLPTVRVPIGKPRPVPEPVLIAAPQVAGDRQRLMLRLGAFAGLRSDEIARVHTRDVEPEGLRMRGKGGTVRIVPIGDDLAKGSGRCRRGRCSAGRPTGIYLVGTSANCSSASSSRATPHTPLRHRFASRAYAGTKDLSAVQELLGHSKPETTARSTLVPDASLIAAVQAAALDAVPLRLLDPMGA